MEALILLVIGVIALPILLLVSHPNGGKETGGKAPSSRPRQTRCPNCGSPVIDHGSYWECGWCGDYGQN